MDLPTSRGSMAAEWAGMSPQQRERAAAVFLGIRELLPEARRAAAIPLWEAIVDALRDTAADVAVSLEGRDRLAQIAESGSDPEGLAFIDRMNRIAQEAIEQYRLPPGERWDVASNPLHQAVAKEAYRRASEGGAK